MYGACTVSLNRQELHDAIDAFIDVHKDADYGDYANVDPTEIDELHKIVYSIVDLKYDTDCDGDSPIQVVILDKTRYRFIIDPFYLFVEHFGSNDNVETFVEHNGLIDKLGMVIKVASDQLYNALRLYHWRNRT